MEKPFSKVLPWPLGLILKMYVYSIAQLCSGLWAGMEGEIYIACELFDLHSDDDWRCCLLMHNMLSSVNRAAALWNTRIFGHSVLASS